ncbi:hypothetical protein QJS10_CPB04g01919 [Acorus calamus]|uniref:Uncharacterized protein n=1 Tax=Acorus calamus TaxID=4465 RepID=A0AAV9F231_ACOCL|nr:hypothetical protein QJS10_CPB04g01919 [Acorus calamus]
MRTMVRGPDGTLVPRSAAKRLPRSNREDLIDVDASYDIKEGKRDILHVITELNDLGSMSQANREGESSEEEEQVVTCDVDGALKFQAKEGATTNEEEDDFGTF